MLDAARLQSISICLDETGKKIIASSTPEGTTEAITLADLKQAIQEAGFGEYQLHHPVLQEALSKYNSGKAFTLVVGEAIDGQFTINIDGSQIAAYLTCTLPLGGSPVQMESVIQEVQKKGIATQLNLSAIEGALKNGGENILIASGKAPVHGTNGKIENLIPAMSNRSPRLDEHGLADFRDLGDIVIVHAGDPLQQRIPPTIGEPGATVLGKPIPANPGKDAVFAAAKNGVVIDPKDSNKLIAAISGYPVQKKNEISVEPVYKVKNVDLHTGNINFEGTVYIAEDVHTGMTVKATGDIHVEGTIEGATLEAGGDIVVKGGILCESDRQCKIGSEITCGGSCHARFAQNAHISAGNGIFINDFSMQSALTAGHQIIVGSEESRKGHIVGGTAYAPMLVKALVIGSDSNIKTIIITGANPSLHDRHAAAIKALKEAEQKLISIAKLLELNQQTPGRIPTESVKAAETTRDATIAEIETLRAAEEGLQKETDLVNAAEIRVEKQLFSGAEIRHGAQRLDIASDRQGGVFHLKDGKLVFE